jgi:hypothetical protein
MKKTALSLGKRLTAISVCILLVALTACGAPAPASPTVAPPSSKPVSASPTGTPPISKPVVVPIPVKGPPVILMGNLISAPKDGAQLVSNAVYVQLDLENINLVNPKATNAEGEGHVNFYLDVDPIPTAAGKTTGLPSPTPAGYKGKIYVGGAAIAQNLGYQWKGVSNGNHTFSAQVVHNDDTPFDPPMVSTVKININMPPASPSPSPAK